MNRSSEDWGLGSLQLEGEKGQGEVGYPSLNGGIRNPQTARMLVSPASPSPHQAQRGSLSCNKNVKCYVVDIEPLHCNFKLVWKLLHDDLAKDRAQRENK